MSRPVSVAGGVGALQSNTTAANIPPQSHRLPLADLLVTNLRLLDFHTRDDWPGITPKTLSTKDTQQNQKLRIKCTEWILYRLFELWDPDETRDKLQPFFPPLEPLQSLNLRAALFRSLNELKKNGVLGRESVLRKTMLDECKGDKLTELLVIFSTLVLRRCDASSYHGQNSTRSAAYKIATAPMLSAAQQGSLIPLSVAHAASLANVLRQRDEKKQRFAQFSELLDGKRKELRQRVKVSVQSKRRESNVNEEAQVRKVVTDSWAGHTRWPQALLTGDDSSPGDLPLQKPFHEVWHVVSEGGSLESSGHPSELGLLASLDRRVQTQRERLQMWQEFHDNLGDHEQQEESRRAAQATASATTKFTFDQHQRLQFIPGRVVTNGRVGQLKAGADAYKAILDTLRADIANASKPRRLGGAGWAAKRDGGSEYREHDFFSPVKSSVAASTSTTAEAQPVRKLDIMRDRPAFSAPPPAEKPKVNGYKIQRLGRNDSKSDTSLSSATIPETKPAPAPAPAPPTNPGPVVDEKEEEKAVRPATPEMSTPIKITQPSPEYEETAADRIISSVVNATPSPAKNHMSLTERTRMSMAFFNKAPDSVDSGIAMPTTTSPSPSDRSNTDDDDTLPAQGGNNVHRRVSLLERTRLSMAAVPAQPKSRKSLRPAKRESLFPVNQFETPGRQHAIPPPRRDATPTEKLFSEEAEYESVFKSRPRIALSPVVSPEETSGLDGSLEGSLELDYDEDEGEDESTEVLGDFRTSPLAARRRMAAG